MHMGCPTCILASSGQHTCLAEPPATAGLSATLPSGREGLSGTLSQEGMSPAKSSAAPPPPPKKQPTPALCSTPPPQPPSSQTTCVPTRPQTCRAGGRDVRRVAVDRCGRAAPGSQWRRHGGRAGAAAVPAAHGVCARAPAAAVQRCVWRRAGAGLV
eukprot:6313-Chlamydomonas_euryale.AAC.2